MKEVDVRVAALERKRMRVRVRVIKEMDSPGQNMQGAKIKEKGKGLIMFSMMHGRDKP